MGTGQAASSTRERAASEPGSSATGGLTFIPGRPRKFNINEYGIYWVSEGHLCQEGVGLCRNRICWADRELRAVVLCAFVLLQRSSLKLMSTEEDGAVHAYRRLQKQREEKHGTLWNQELC